MTPAAYGIINAFFPGLAYILLGKRALFGWLLIISMVCNAILAFIAPHGVSESFFLSTTMFGKTIQIVGMMAGAIAFAYDAHKLAQQK